MTSSRLAGPMYFNRLGVYVCTIVVTRYSGLFQFAKSVVCQSHLCPLPLHVSPVYWSYDNALRLYPLPDVLVTADKFDPFSVTQVDCTVVNPVS